MLHPLHIKYYYYYYNKFLALLIFQATLKWTVKSELSFNLKIYIWVYAYFILIWATKHKFIKVLFKVKQNIFNELKLN